MRGAPCLRIERRLDRRHGRAETRAPSPPAHDRAGCAACRPRSARRCGGCRDARRAAPARAACCAAISASGSAWLATMHDRAVIEHDAVAVAQRHRLVEVEQERVPCSPVSTMRRRCRSPESSSTRSTAVAGFQWPARQIAQPRFTLASRPRQTIMAGTNSRRRSCRSLAPSRANIQPPARATSMRAPTSRPARSPRPTPPARSRFSTSMQARLRVAAAHAHQVVPGLLRGRRQRRIPARRRGVPRQEGRLRQHPARHAAQGRLQGRHAHADGVLARPASKA